jgi:hypothetical protein
MECETEHENRGRKRIYSPGDVKINLPSSRLRKKADVSILRLSSVNGMKYILPVTQDTLISTSVPTGLAHFIIYSSVNTTI